MCGVLGGHAKSPRAGGATSFVPARDASNVVSAGADAYAAAVTAASTNAPLAERSTRSNHRSPPRPKSMADSSAAIAAAAAGSASPKAHALAARTPAANLAGLGDASREVPSGAS